MSSLVVFRDPLHLREALQAELYTSIFEPELGWKSILQRFADATGAKGGVLIPVMAVARGPEMTRTDSISDLFEGYVKGEWHLRDTRQKGLIQWRKRKVFIDQDYMTPIEADHDPMIQDLLVPIGYKYAAVMHVSYGDASYAFSLQRELKRGPFQMAEQELLEDLSTNVSLAARISGEMATEKYRTTLQVLEGLNVAAVAIGYDRKLKFSNQKFDQLLGPVFKTSGGRLHLLNDREDQNLQALVDRSLSVRVVGEKTPEVMLKESPMESPMIVRAMAFPRTGMNLFSGVGAILFLWNLKVPEARGLPERTKKFFRFSPAEARLSTLLHEGLSPQECADRLQISVETVRSQIKSMFAKTETRRHSELTQLLARLSLFG